MRILCPLRIYYIEEGLIWGLRKIGCEVKTLHGGPISREELAAAMEDFRPDLFFSFGWWLGHLLPEDLAWLRDRYRFPHVYWANDDPTHHGYISLPLARLADLVFTTTEEFGPIYRAMGKKAAYLQFGCNPELHRRLKPDDPGDGHDVVLVANNYSAYEFMDHSFRSRCMDLIIKPLLDGEFRLKIFGGGWDDTSKPFHIPSAYAGPAVAYEQLADLYSSAKIVLGLQTEWHSRTQTSCRPFEAMGCRAFHLAPATRSMTSLFIPGKHLVVTRSPAETVDLVRYYLANEGERSRIASAGQLEVYGKHTYLHRAREFLSRINEAL